MFKCVPLSVDSYKKSKNHDIGHVQTPLYPLYIGWVLAADETGDGCSCCEPAVAFPPAWCCPNWPRNVPTIAGEPPPRSSVIVCCCCCCCLTAAAVAPMAGLPCCDCCAPPTAPATPPATPPAAGVPLIVAVCGPLVWQRKHRGSHGWRRTKLLYSRRSRSFFVQWMASRQTPWAAFSRANR